MLFYIATFIASILAITFFFSLGHYTACIGMLNKKWEFKTFLLYFMIVFVPQTIINFGLTYLILAYSIENSGLTLMQTTIFNVVYGFVFSSYAIVLAFIMYKKYQINFLQSLFTSSLSYFLVFACEVAIADILENSRTVLFKNSSEIITENLLVILPHFGMIIMGCLLFFLSRKFKTYRYLTVFNSSKIRTVVYIILIFLFLNPSIFIPSIIPEGNRGAAGGITLTVFSLGVLVVLLIMGNIFQSQKKVELQSALIAQQTAYMDAMKGLHTEMRTFRHDFQNLMMGVGVHLSSDDLDGVKHFMEDMSLYFDKRIGEELRYWESLMNIDHALLKNLLAVKLTEMQNNDIEISLKIPEYVKNINMPEEDFIRCIGILLDNAKEATEHLQKGIANLLFLQEKNELTVIVENNFEQAPQLSLLYDKGYTTKGDGHGVGLTSYRSITKRYENVSSRTRCENGMFIQEMRIFK